MDTFWLLHQLCFLDWWLLYFGDCNWNTVILACFFFNVCMCVYVHACVCSVYVEVRGWHGVSFRIHSYHSLQTGSEPPPSAFPVLGSQLAGTVLAFTWGLGIKLEIFSLHGKHLTNWAIKINTIFLVDLGLGVYISTIYKALCSVSSIAKQTIKHRLYLFM